MNSASVPDANQTPLPEPLRRNDALTCEECGVEGAYAIADRHLCDACYQLCGACCQGDDCAEDAD